MPTKARLLCRSWVDVESDSFEEKRSKLFTTLGVRRRECASAQDVVEQADGERVASGEEFMSPSLLAGPVNGAAIRLGGLDLRVHALCGRGEYADVYEASMSSPGFSGPGSAFALKVSPDVASLLKEFWILRALAARVPEADRHLVLRAYHFHSAGTVAYLTSDFCPYGSLQDAVNVYRKSGKAASELVAMFYSYELLRAVLAIHSAGIAHNDIKPDNVLLRCGGGWAPWAAPGSGDTSWKDKGVMLIDFGLAVDHGNGHPGCLSHFEADLRGLLDCVHCLLHGQYMAVDTARDGSGRLRAQAPLKRYWATNIWHDLFDSLLNAELLSAYQQSAARCLRKLGAHMGDRSVEVAQAMLQHTLLMYDSIRDVADSAPGVRNQKRARRL